MIALWSGIAPLSLFFIAHLITFPSRAEAATCEALSGNALRVDTATDVESLIAAVNCSDGGNLTVTWSGEIRLDTTIPIGAGTFLSIAGEDDRAVISGNNSGRILEVSPGAGLVLHNLTLEHGSASSGGAIFSDSATVSLHNCVFQHNHAKDGSGGAFMAEGGTVNVVGGKFVNNYATASGGAMATVGSTVTISEETKFIRNTATEGAGLSCVGASADDGAESSLSEDVPTCSVTNAIFRSNNASQTFHLQMENFEAPWTNLYGGGGATFLWATVDITGCRFESNYAQLSGGAIHAGNATELIVKSSRFDDNYTPGYGGGVSVSNATFKEGSVMTSNMASVSGGAIFGWDIDGVVVVESLQCINSTAIYRGGCVHGAGTVLVQEDTEMVDNVAEYGGCLYAAFGSDFLVEGGDYICQSTKNGAFLFASDGGRVNITYAYVHDSYAARRAGAVYCSGDSYGYGGSMVTISGGDYLNNSADELGGAVVAWGDTTVVTISGGTFTDNYSRYYGGFIFLEEEASLVCSGASILNNYAGDQGGGIYARDATWLNVSCDVTSNKSPQGAGVYATNTYYADFDNMTISENCAAHGSNVFIAHSQVKMRNVIFDTGSPSGQDATNRAIQIEGDSTLHAQQCVFIGWTGDTVIYSDISTGDHAFLLDSCDFRECSPSVVVTSPHSAAEIRNALVGDRTLSLADDPLALVDNAVGCEDQTLCGSGACANASLGVVCECLSYLSSEKGGAEVEEYCLDGGEAISMGVHTYPEDVIYSPNLIEFKLYVAASDQGTTDTAWELSYSADDMQLEVYPQVGLLHPGDNITVTVTGTPDEGIGGNFTSRFSAYFLGSRSESDGEGIGSSSEAYAEVTATFYLCRAFQVAVGYLEDEEGAECEQCLTLEGADGINCDEPGATVAALPVLEGYWRSSAESLVVRTCLHHDACIGETDITSSDDYCADGYSGPYCAVCTDGYRAGVGNTCHSCSGDKAKLLIALGSILCFVTVVCLSIVVIFLIGGLDAVGSMGRSVANSLSLKGLSGTTVSSSRPTSIGPVAPAYGEAGSGTWRSSRRLLTGAILSDGVLGDKKSVSADGTGPSENVAEELRRGSRCSCGSIGAKIKGLMNRLPLDKLKILVVVWQILAVFPSITSVEFPSAYASFLSWIDAVNLDLGHVFSASCILPRTTFYQRLLAITLTPLVLLCVLLVTYNAAKRRAGIGRSGVAARRAAWSRHMAAGLLLTFLVFTSASTAIFKTFACDYDAVEGKSFLRDDYSLSCNTDTHELYKAYARVMVLVYPIGIPVLYFVILWKNRSLLNPALDVRLTENMEDDKRAAGRGVKDFGDFGDFGRTDNKVSPLAESGDPKLLHDEEELRRKVLERKHHPDLVPSMFLWKDFGPDLYYYEVIECGRRILLTGVLIFVAPQSTTQAAMACIFAFASLLGFELLRPHLDRADAWLYRLGCVVIFLSNFLALLIKTEAAGEERREALGVLLVLINIALVLAVLCTSWFATQQSVDDSRDDDNTLNVIKAMMTAEKLAVADELDREKVKWTKGSGKNPVGSPREQKIELTPAAGNRERDYGSGSLDSHASMRTIELQYESTGYPFHNPRGLVDGMSSHALDNDDVGPRGTSPAGEPSMWPVQLDEEIWQVGGQRDVVRQMPDTGATWEESQPRHQPSRELDEVLTGTRARDRR